jgi:hypothetical protein
MTTSDLLLIPFSSKRVQQQKRRKEKERKDLETLGRKSYLDVRIVQRNVVYVVGLGPRYAKEEVMTVASVIVPVLQLISSPFFCRPSLFCDHPTTLDDMARSREYSCKSEHHLERTRLLWVSILHTCGVKMQSVPCKPSMGPPLPAVVAR